MGEVEAQVGSPADLADEWLMLWVGRGDTAAFDELHRRHHRRVYNVALRPTGDAGLAEDVTQETFLRLLGAAPSYEPRARFSTWLLGITANLCRDVARRRAARPVLETGVEGDAWEWVDHEPGSEDALAIREGREGSGPRPASPPCCRSSPPCATTVSGCSPRWSGSTRTTETP